MFVVLEGPDKCGKDTQLNLLANKLDSYRLPYRIVQDPSPHCPEIRQLLLTKKLTNTARLHLFMAARAELISKEIKPALKAGQIVVCNRFYLSTLAYQGLYFNKQDIEHLHRISRCNIMPDLQIIYLASNPLIPPQSQDNVMDHYCKRHRSAIIANYLALAKDPKHHAKVVWVGKPPEHIAQTTWALVKETLDKHHLKQVAQ